MHILRDRDAYYRVPLGNCHCRVGNCRPLCPRAVGALLYSRPQNVGGPLPTGASCMVWAAGKHQQQTSSLHASTYVGAHGPEHHAHDALAACSTMHPAQHRMP